jgi:F0F1-type ATP synthase epsilon subunit
MAQPTAENTKSAAAIVREEDLSDLQGFQSHVEEKIATARDEGRIYMMQQYVRILAGVTSEVKKISARFERERMASHNNELKTMKKAKKEKEDAEKEKA